MSSHFNMEERRHDSRLCCIQENGERCKKAAGSANYSKKLQKLVSQHKLPLRLDVKASHIYMCEQHHDWISKAPRVAAPGASERGGVGCARPQRRRAYDERERDEEVPRAGGAVSKRSSVAQGPPPPDLAVLGLVVLRKYRKFFKLQPRQSLNKAQLADAVARHFRGLRLLDREKEVLNNFFYQVRGPAVARAGAAGAGPGERVKSECGGGALSGKMSSVK